MWGKNLINKKKGDYLIEEKNIIFMPKSQWGEGGDRK